MKESHETAYDLIAMIGRSVGVEITDDMPSMSDLGLNPDNTHSAAIHQFIFTARRAYVDYSEYGENSYAYGFCSAMIEYTIVSDDEVRNAISHYKYGKNN